MSKATITAERLRIARENLGLTQSGFASALDVSLRTVARWELGETKIPFVVELAIKMLKTREATRQAIRECASEAAPQKISVENTPKESDTDW